MDDFGNNIADFGALTLAHIWHILYFFTGDGLMGNPATMAIALPVDNPY
jgi:hypothetical protein